MEQDQIDKEQNRLGFAKLKDEILRREKIAATRKKIVWLAITLLSIWLIYYFS